MSNPYTRTLFATARTAALAVAAIALTALPTAADEAPNLNPGLTNPGPGFIPPPLHPAGVELETQPLGDGVYALVANHVAVDNGGFIVGDDGVLVIDAHINGAMARQIQDAVRAVTELPILYLVNTNYHGDHTFGNYAFPATTRIVAHRETAARMKDFEHEKQVLLGTVNGDASIYADVELRLPDMTFEDRLSLDLGGRVVDVFHFGPGNTPGDTVVFEPTTRTAWTGNLVVGEGTIPPIFEGGVRDYLGTITTFRQALPVSTIVPGHGRLTTGAILGRYSAYLSALVDEVDRVAASIDSDAALIEALPLARFVELPAELAGTPAAAFLQGLHGLNLRHALRESKLSG